MNEIDFFPSHLHYDNFDPAVVALGGGHGLSATLQALRHVTRKLSAIVTVADDGGSSGRIRKEMNVLPPGDLRMALSALCQDSEWGLTWRDVLQYRFDCEGELNGHSLGNLLITGLWQILGDEVRGLQWVAKLLSAKGKVFPMASEPVDIEAVFRTREGLVQVSGQSNVAKARGQIEQLRLNPSQPKVPRETLEAIEQAQWIVLGPGSWYTSVLPHLLVKDIRQGLEKSRAQKIVVMNLSRQSGETEFLPISQHLDVIFRYAPKLNINAVIADPAAVENIDELWDISQKMGAKLLLRQVRSSENAQVHDSLRLAAAFKDVFEGIFGDV